VIGSKNSSNSNRLVEEALLAGARAYLVDDASGVDPRWLEGADTVGVTSGASAPEFLVDQIVAALKSLGAERVEDLVTVEEDVHFPLPSDLVEARARRAGATLPSLPA
jgi:4-hydroxy-3-methylbut-2-enyl diphosphate reductase